MRCSRVAAAVRKIIAAITKISKIITTNNAKTFTVNNFGKLSFVNVSTFRQNNGKFARCAAGIATIMVIAFPRKR